MRKRLTNSQRLLRTGLYALTGFLIGYAIGLVALEDAMAGLVLFVLYMATMFTLLLREA
jgi:hypothetical protein